MATRVQTDSRPLTQGLPVYARTAFTYRDVNYSPGDEFDPELCSVRKLEVMFRSRRLTHGRPAQAVKSAPVPAKAKESKPRDVTNYDAPQAQSGIEALGGGWHSVTVGGETRRVRGLAKAQEVAAGMAAA